MLEPGADVIALGFGQAFTDLVDPRHRGPRRPLRRRRRRHAALRAERAGAGRSTSARDAACRTGRSSTTGCRRRRPPLPRFLDDAGDRAPARPGDGRSSSGATCCRSSLKEVGWAYYHELFLAHPERTTRAVGRLRRARTPTLDGRAEIDRLVAAAVPDPADRFDLEALDRPARRAAASSRPTDLHVHVRPPRRRRRRPPHRPDLQRRPRRVHGAAAHASARSGASARRAGSTPRSRVEDLGRVVVQLLHVLRQRAAARPAAPVPGPRRRRAACASSAPTRRSTADADRGPLRRPQHAAIPTTIVAHARWSTPASPRRRSAGPTDALLRRLHERGEVVEEVVSDGDGWTANTGKVVVTGPDLRLARGDGTSHPRRHAVGVFTNRPAAGAFARPRTNAPAFRQNDRSPGPSSRRWPRCTRRLPSPVRA